MTGESRGILPRRPQCLGCGKHVNAIVDFCARCRAFVCKLCFNKPKHQGLHTPIAVKPRLCATCEIAPAVWECLECNEPCCTACVATNHVHTDPDPEPPNA